MFHMITGQIREKIKFLPLVAILSVGVASCDIPGNYHKIDRTGDMTRSDYRKALEAKPASSDPFAEEYRKSQLKMMPLPQQDARVADITGNIPVISVSVNRRVPLRDVLFDLADRANFDLILDPSITGSIIYTARNKPFDQVIADISDLAGLKYEFKGRSLRVELDRPYMKRYRVSYLNMTRGFTSSLNSAVSVAGSGTGASNSSNYSLSNGSDGDFWASISSDVAQIMGLSEEYNAVLRTSADPQLEVIQVSAQDLRGSTNVNSSGEASSDSILPEIGGANEALDIAASGDASSTQSGDSASSDDSASSGEDNTAFIVNRIAGLVTVFGTSQQHRLVEEYLDDIKQSVGTQIFIEAKVLEVQLTDEFSAGINWQLLFRDGLGIENIALNAAAPALSPSTTNSFSFVLDRQDLDGTVSALNRFGTVRALASPRLAVMNNQTAELNGAKNRVFFTVELEEEEDDDTGDTTLTISSEVNTVPEGIIINVMPVANADTGEIMMSVRPSVTRIDETVNDPGVALIASRLGLSGSLESQVPVVDVREIDTIVKMLSGQAVVIGGLIQDRAVSTQEGLPVANDIPILGSLFRNQGDRAQKYELVILLRAVVMEGRNNVHPTDEYLYKNFGGDRRPFKM